MNKKYDTQEFIKKAKQIHGEKYNYSSTIYHSFSKNVIIKCKIHGQFNQTPKCHLAGRGCKKCGYCSMGMITRYSQEEILQKFKNTHMNTYDYSKFQYKSYDEKSTIICNIHGSFQQSANCHIRGQGCRKCGFLSTSSKRTLKQTQFIQKAINVHGKKYDYSKTLYKNGREKIIIICPLHGQFLQQPDNHIYCGKGCQICKQSKGQKAINKWLNAKGINFIKQKKFPQCKNIRCLPFDFYLPDFNICIEYDGQQHFQPKSFGSKNNHVEKMFQSISKNDIIKNTFCINNGIKMIRIKYTQENIQDFLKQSLNFS